MALRSWWDYLGICAAVSGIAILLTAMPLSLGGLLLRTAGRSPIMGLLVVASATVWLHVIWCACCRFGKLVVDRDEPTLGQFAAALTDGNIVASALVQSGVWLTIAANGLFYGALPGVAGFVIRILCAYVGITWAMSQMYQAPLLALAHAGSFVPASPFGNALRSIRNSFVIIARKPIYSLGLAATICPCIIVLSLSGAGLVFVLPIWLAIVCTTATRYILVEIGHLPPPPDMDTPIVDVPWRFKG